MRGATPGTLEAVTEHYRQKVENYRAEANDAYHFEHIVGNAFGSLEQLTKFVTTGRYPLENIRGTYLSALRVLRQYFRLLDQNQAYRQAELNTQKGFFPDLDNHGGERYLHIAEQRLKEEKK